MGIKSGSIGARWDISLRAGDTFGPYAADLVDPITRLPVNLTGSTFSGAITKADGTSPVALTITVTDAPNGKIQWYALGSSTTGLDTTGATFFTPADTSTWYLKWTDSGGNEQTLFYGQVNIAKGTPP